MARIYAPHSFKASNVNAAFYRFLEALDDNAVVLLEFVSQGPATRQVDCAVLSSAGVDLLEVKDKRGRVMGYAHAPWEVIDDQGRHDQIVNLKGGQRENPYEQASNTANDFQACLRSLLNGRRVPVYPIVVIPTAHPSSTFENHHQTWVANGVEELAQKMRAYRHRYDKRLLSQDEIMRVVERLRLSPVGLAFLEGRALDRATGKGIAGVEIRLFGEQLAEDLVETTDDQGRFRATVPIGTLTLDFRPPFPYEGRRFTYEARQGQNRIQDQEFSSIAPATPAAPDPREELGKLLEQVQQLLARSSVKAEVEASKTILEVLERERREREALYELILEQASRPQQSSSSDPHPPSQELLNELQEIRRLLGQITEARTPQERSQAVHQVQTLLPQLFDRPFTAAAPSTAARAAPVEVIEARPADTVRRRTARWPLALALLPLVILGGWLAWPRPAGDTPVPSAAAHETEKPMATGLEGARTTVSSPSSRTVSAPAPDVRESPAVNPSPTPASEPRPTPRATPQPLAARTPEPDVKAPDKASAGRLQPKTPTPPAPTARSVPQATPEPTVQVTPPRSEPKTSTSTAGPPPGEPLPGAPLEPEPSATPVAEPLPGEALPGQPLAASQGVAPVGAYCPATHPVKGNLSYSGERIYHLPNQEYYDKTKPEVCFATAGEAEQAGFRPSSH
jgi:hypothetical protein